MLGASPILSCPEEQWHKNRYYYILWSPWQPPESPQGKENVCPLPPCEGADPAWVLSSLRKLFCWWSRDWRKSSTWSIGFHSHPSSPHFLLCSLHPRMLPSGTCPKEHYRYLELSLIFRDQLWSLHKRCHKHALCHIYVTQRWWNTDTTNKEISGLGNESTISSTVG